jgi:hypothetical protein
MEGKGQRQLAVRVDDETLVAVDKKRMEIAAQMGKIPTRSDVVRIALETYLKSSDEPQKKNQSK